MKLEIVISGKFKKDLKLAKKRGCDVEQLNVVVEQLSSGIPLEEKYRDHALSGEYAGFRECHIEPDWLLIYRMNQKELVLLLFRTGTHSDLF